jgi:basic membrane protein A
MRKLLALLSVLALTGCAVQEPAPTITPVDLKYCAVSDAAGYNDDGLNRSVYAAMQQLKVQTGAAVSAVEVSDKLTASAALQKMVDAGCNAIIASGSALVSATLATSKNNPNIHFYTVSDAAKSGATSANYTAITFDIGQAAYVAGYLSAATTDSGAVANRININNRIKSAPSLKIEKAFALGVDRFNTKNKKQVSVVISDVHSGEEIIFGLAGNATQLGLIAQSSATPQVKYVGFGRDWYSDVRNKDIKSSILTSVIRVDAIGKVVDAVVNQKASEHFDLSNDGVGLVDAHDVSWPIGFGGEVSQIIKDFQDGKVKVD